MLNKPKKVGIITLGCRVNQYESAYISEVLKNKGYEVVSEGDDCEYYVVNTCAVTAESERKSRQAVRKAAKNARVAVIGCASQINPVFKDIPNVIYVSGCRDKKGCIDAIVNDDGSLNYNVKDMSDAVYEDMSVSDLKPVFSECRAFVKIEDGCNGKCAYCIIPKCRGKVRSRDAESIIREAETLALRGYKEIILTGIEVSAYNKMSLPELIKRVAEIDGIERIRLGSLSPNLITEKFVKSVSECDKFMPHVHLSLQSCNDKVLKDMRRPYSKQDIVDKVAVLRKYIPNCMLSADIIVGFPGETESDFSETADCLEKLGVFHIHAFPYSERKGTPAADMPNKVPKEIRYIRNAELIKKSESIKAKILESISRDDQKILVEKIENGIAYGHTEGYLDAKIKINDKTINIGDIVSAKIISNDGNALECVFTEEQK